MFFGDCPETKVSPFDCYKMKHLQLYGSTKSGVFLIMAILESSKNPDKSSIFDYDTYNKDQLPFLSLIISCHSKTNKKSTDTMHIFCDNQDFNNADRMKFIPELTLIPGQNNSLSLKNKNCRNQSTLEKNMKLFAYMTANGLVFHECQKINETHAELGLMVLLSTHKTMQNVNKSLENIFNEMNLGNLSTFKKLIVNDKQFDLDVMGDPSKICNKKPFGTDCKFESDRKSNTQINIYIFVGFCMLVLFILLCLIFYFIKL